MAKDNKPIDGGDAIEEKIAVAVETPVSHLPAQPVRKSGVYNTIDEVPEVFRPAVRAALKKVGFNGKRLLAEDDAGSLNLTDERLWIIDMCYNGGMYR